MQHWRGNRPPGNPEGAPPSAPGIAVWLGVLSWAGVLLAGDSRETDVAAGLHALRCAAGIRVELFADSSQIHQPAALGFDSAGRLYAVEVHRRGAGAEELRGHPEWLLEDLSIQRSADRLALYHKAAASGGLPMAHWTGKADRVRLLGDLDGDGRADRVSVFADGFDDPLDGPAGGLLAGTGGLFFADVPNLWWLADADGDGVSESRKPLVAGFGVRLGVGSHGLRGPVWGPDGRVYWAAGDRGYAVAAADGKELANPVSGAVFRCEPDGSKLEVYYEGLRNPGDLAFDQSGDLFVCDDSSGAWDPGRLIYVLEGGSSGWQAGYQVLLQYQAELALRTPVRPGARDGLPRPLTAWLDEGLCLPRHANQPAWILPPVAELGPHPGALVFNSGGTALPGESNFFLCQMAGARSGLGSIAVRRKGAGVELREYAPAWLSGAECSDAEFGPDGRLYLSCSGTGWQRRGVGAVYTVFDPRLAGRPAVLEVRPFLTEPLAQMAGVELADRLSHEDMRVRLRAQFELASRGETSLPLLEGSVRQTLRPLRRYHGIWGLSQIARATGSSRAVKCLVELAADPDAEIRAQAARALGDVADERAGRVLLSLLGDESPRVRCLACLALARRGTREGAGEILRVLENNADADPWLRHGAVVALAAASGEDELAKLASGQRSVAVRRGAVLALRRQGSARLREFVADPDTGIAGEAVRAIDDLKLEDALPDVARCLDRAAAPAGEDPRNWLHHLRLIQANWRTGDEAAAARLAAYAGREDIPGELRVHALQALAEWRRTAPVDPVAGLVRPVAMEHRTELPGVCRDVVTKLMRQAEGEVLAAAVRLGHQAKVEIPFPELKRLVAEPKLGISARMSAWEELRSRSGGRWKEAARALLADPEQRMRAAALSALLSGDPVPGLQAAAEVVRKGEIGERQQAVRGLAAMGTPEALALLSALWSDVLSGSGDDAILLELAEAAARHPELAGFWNRYQSGVDKANPGAAFRECLAGGNAGRGAELFASHPGAACSGCHRAAGDGAGPDLSGIGERRSPLQILTALVAPSAGVAPGYGLPQGTERAAGGGADSCMPPGGDVLSPGELRDLVAFLGSWKRAGRL